jgi:hypothetical protein
VKTNLDWRKSSRSNAANACVEVAFAPRAAVRDAQVIAVRDSKNTSGPTLAYPVVSWEAFRAGLRGNQA